MTLELSRACTLSQDPTFHMKIQFLPNAVARQPPQGENLAIVQVPRVPSIFLMILPELTSHTEPSKLDEPAFVHLGM